MPADSNYARVASELERVCIEAHRAPEEVRLVAVSKTVGIPEVALARAGGASDFGENRPDDLLLKAPTQPDATWHFIGNIQSRRIGDIVAHADLVHSLYQERHAVKMNSQAQAIGKIQDVLLEVNVSGEESKSGLSPDRVEEMLQKCEDLSNIRVCGLMTMAPQGDLGAAKRSFEGLAELKNRLRAQMNASNRDDFNELSMGMSEDWREAVYAGATIIRIGRAIFSDEFAV